MNHFTTAAKPHPQKLGLRNSISGWDIGYEDVKTIVNWKQTHWHKIG